MDEGIFCLLFCKTLPLDFHKIDYLNLCKILSLSTKQRFLNLSLKKSQKIQGKVLIHLGTLHRKHLILFFSPIQ